MCGVSVATVSRALNGHPEVSEETRRQVQLMAERVGYRPSMAARALVRGRSNTVGLLWDTSYEAAGRRHPFLASMVIGVKQALSAVDKHLILLNVDADQHGPRAYLDIARQFQLDGVLAMAVPGREQALRVLAASELPSVGIDTEMTGPHSACVASDNQAGAMEAVRHLYGLGHRRIATITGPPAMMPARLRLAGYREAARELDLARQYVYSGDFFFDSGYTYGAGLARLSSRRRPTAVFAAGDEMALGAMHAFADAGLEVPGDIAVVGFDDIEAASLIRPALTTVAQDTLALGTAAVHTLLRFVGGQELSTSSPVLVPTTLIVRQSCGARSGSG